MADSNASAEDDSEAVSKISFRELMIPWKAVMGNPCLPLSGIRVKVVQLLIWTDFFLIQYVFCKEIGTSLGSFSPPELGTLVFIVFYA